MFIVAWGVFVGVFYGLTNIFTFFSSTMCHSQSLSEDDWDVWAKLDELSIYALVAGTYTPLAYKFLPVNWMIGILAAQWTFALTGITIKLFKIRTPRWVNAGIHLIQGWMVAVCAHLVFRGWGVLDAILMITGGLAYSPNAQAGERNFIIRGAGTNGDTNEINNTASTVFATAGSEYRGVRKVNKVHATTGTVKLGANSDTTFDILAKPSTAMVPGRTKGTGAGSAQNFVQVDGATAATDDAASPTRSVPGELTYHFGGLAKPTTDEYKARNSYEA